MTGGDALRRELEQAPTEEIQPAAAVARLRGNRWRADDLHRLRLRWAVGVGGATAGTRGIDDRRRALATPWHCRWQRRIGCDGGVGITVLAVH